MPNNSIVYHDMISYHYVNASGQNPNVIDLCSQDYFNQNFDDLECKNSIYLIAHVKKEFTTEKSDGYYTSGRIFIKGVVLDLQSLQMFLVVFLGLSAKQAENQAQSIYDMGVDHVILMVARRNGKMNVMMIPFDIDNDKCHTITTLALDEYGHLTKEAILNVMKSGVIYLDYDNNSDITNLSKFKIIS